MGAWFSTLSGFEQIVYPITIISSLIMVVKFVLAVVGIDSSFSGALDAADAVDGLDALDAADAADAVDAADAANAVQSVDAAHAIEIANAAANIGPLKKISSLHLLSLQGILAFLTIGGWCSIFLYRSSSLAFISLFVGFLAGIGGMFGNAFLVRSLMGLQTSGNVNIKKAVGLIGEVYMEIPKYDEGIGKVTLMLNGQSQEYDAISRDDTSIPFGTHVRVMEVNENGVLIVQRQSEEEKV